MFEHYFLLSTYHCRHHWSMYDRSVHIYSKIKRTQLQCRFEGTSSWICDFWLPVCLPRWEQLDALDQLGQQVTLHVILDVSTRYFIRFRKHSRIKSNKSRYTNEVIYKYSSFSVLVIAGHSGLLTAPFLSWRMTDLLLHFCRSLITTEDEEILLTRLRLWADIIYAT